MVVHCLRICLTMQGDISGKIPHASGQLSPCTTTAEAYAPRAQGLQQENFDKLYGFQGERNSSFYFYVVSPQEHMNAYAEYVHTNI